MPSCFQLTKKGEQAPARLQTVDDEMRVAFGADPDPDKWFEQWYNTIGLGLAMGHDWVKLREIFKETALVAVVDWLEANYTTDSWYEHKS